MNNHAVLYILVTAIGTFIGTIIAVLLVPMLSSMSFRKHHNIIDIRHVWKSEWYIDNTPYSIDFMTIEKWLKNGHFAGHGINKKGDYTISGELTGTQYLSATYRNVDFPTVGYFGSFITKIDVPGKRMEGYWQGRVADGNIRGGRIISTMVEKISYEEIWESTELS